MKVQGNGEGQELNGKIQSPNSKSDGLSYSVDET
jgi:hypothetical protein